MERYESWDYSPTMVAGRLSFRTAGHQWPETRLKDWQMIYTFFGQGLIAHKAEQWVTGEGDLILFRPHQPRTYEPAGRPLKWNHIWVHFEPDESMRSVLQRLVPSDGYARYRLPTPELQKKVMANLSEMCDVGASRAAYREKLADKLLETVLVRCLSVIPPESFDARDPRLKRAMDILSENLRASFDSAELATVCGLSERQLFRMFDDQTQYSPRSYLETCRIHRAKHLLSETEMSIGEVGEQVGFKSAFYFSMRFKIHTGQSPRTYRNGLRAGSEITGNEAS